MNNINKKTKQWKYTNEQTLHMMRRSGRALIRSHHGKYSQIAAMQHQYTHLKRIGKKLLYLIYLF